MKNLIILKKETRRGFEVDQHICFLLSYYFHPTDASQADTLYISVVIKGTAFIVEDNEEKAQLNGLMKKYQKEGKYEILDPFMPSVHEVAVIKIVPKEMRGKYKIGQHWAPAYRLKMANILKKKKKICRNHTQYYGYKYFSRRSFDNKGRAINVIILKLIIILVSS